ncbi:30S ribosomal protein S5 [Bacteroidetes bacterium endosymbiont of Geopemphigus sp.]|uniref:30S ribosomal protein S5 n=1 Tax=Bacteroidetes bacterium endosymbiont of Geopemphigus sp. TaxID=2047937 RepID=UPI00397782EB
MLRYKNIEKVKPTALEKKISKLIGVDRVVKVTKGGRDFSYRALVVVGNETGVVGYGSGKSKDLSEAISKAEEDAKKKLLRIPTFNGSIPHEQEARYSGACVFMRPASQGTGVIAGGAVRAVLEVAGIRNVLSKSKGSSNAHNVVKATFKALLSMRDLKSVAKERGISMQKIFKG